MRRRRRTWSDGRRPGSDGSVAPLGARVPVRATGSDRTSALRTRTLSFGPGQTLRTLVPSVLRTSVRRRYCLYIPRLNTTAERTEPAEHVVHVAQVDHLDQVAVEVAREEERVPARRLLRRADDTRRPCSSGSRATSAGVAHVEADVRQADAVPRHVDRPAAAARTRRSRARRRRGRESSRSCSAAPRPVDAEEAAHALGRRVGDADQRAAEHVPVELHRPVEVRHRDADVAERIVLSRGCLRLRELGVR